jgi:hypothetical protein
MPVVGQTVVAAPSAGLAQSKERATDPSVNGESGVAGEGRDTDGLVRLSGIEAALRLLGYEPILTKDVPDHPHQDLSQKVVAIAAISRFIIVDDSTKSGHLAEVQLCKASNWITVLLPAHGIGASYMTAGASIFSNVVSEREYDPETRQLAVASAVAWAENKICELERRLDGTYPWRRSQ